MITIKLPKIEDVIFEVSCHPEHVSPRDSFALDIESEDRIIEAIEESYNNGNDWAWCAVKVTGTYKGLESHDYLGWCSYDSKQDFIDNSGYYDDMCNEVYNDIINSLKSFQ